jgi:hypothetical protein
MISEYVLDKPLRTLHVARTPGAEKAAYFRRLFPLALLISGILPDCPIAMGVQETYLLN